MKLEHSISEHDLKNENLYVDAIYQGGRKGNASDDPFPRLLKVSNQGGFRYRGTLDQIEMVVLTSSLNDPDWPDAIDRETGVFTYYGDNKKPGLALHATPRNGNELLRRIFENAHNPITRCQVPPIFVFANVGTYRDARFLGLAVPGALEQNPSEDLVAIWRVSNGKRFQNYRAHFTILDVAEVKRDWIRNIINNGFYTDAAPKVWLDWVKTGRAKALKAIRSVEYRRRAEQIPSVLDDVSMLSAMHSHFADRPHDFEKCAGAIANMLLPNISSLEFTRPSRDGGRDAVGTLKLGSGAASILVEFALEAKCFGIGNPVGVREISRLISRLRHRQFGILVTTSFLDVQAYKEIKEDRHPIIVVAANDIIHLLKMNGLSTAYAVKDWLMRDFSATAV